jgi:hypothetical protein
VRRVFEYSLWTGNRGDVRDSMQTRSAGIHAIIDLAMEESPLNIDRERVLVRIPIMDGAGDSHRLRLAVLTAESLVRANVPTLIVCSAGLSRSPAIAVHAVARIEQRAPSAVLAELAKSGAIDVSPALWNALSQIQAT